MKTLVAYKSKTGFTRNYAQWLAQELSADLIEVPKVTPEMLMAYDTIILGGGLYAGGINGVKLMKNNLAKLKDKKLVVFATGASPVLDEVFNEIRDKNFTSEQQAQIKLFYLRGGFDYNQLKPLDRFLTSIMKMMLKRKKDLTPEERSFLSAYDEPVDFTNKENIKPIVSYINS
jgi:menaquinone-dependent protoporphyrinogen IX oxidase